MDDFGNGYNWEKCARKFEGQSFSYWEESLKLIVVSTQVVLLPVFLVSLVAELTVLVKLLSVTCADLDVCSLLQRSGESGTKRSTLDKSENLLFKQFPGFS